MGRFLKFYLIPFLILNGFYFRSAAQAYSPFDGHPENFHVNLRRYFADPQTESLQRGQLLGDVKLFLSKRAPKKTDPVKFLTAYEGLLARLKKHEEYFRLLGYINNKDEAARRNEELISEKISTLHGFIGRRLKDQQTGKYAYLLNDLRQTAAHKLSAKDEALADKLTGVSLNRLTDRYDELMDHITAADITDTEGNKLNALRNRGQILRSKDPKVRKAGAIAFNEAYSNHGEMLGATLIDIAAERNALAKLSAYKSAPERSYARKLQLSESSVRDLLNEMIRHTAALKAYQQLQAKHTADLTGLNKVNSYDLSVSGGYTWQPKSYEATRQLILKALVPLGSDYQTGFAWLLDPANGALEIAGGPNRVNENTSIGYPGTPVSLYMKSYNGALGDLLRLSHEGGHAIHMKLMSGIRVPSYVSGPSFMFEAFAMLNELLVLDELQQQAVTFSEKAYYTNQFIAKLSRELFTSAEEGTFEQDLYEGVAAGKIKNRHDIDSLYTSIMNQYDLFFPNEQERKSEWINKRLLFDDPLYNINYLYAMLVTCKLYDQLHQNPKGFAANYSALLKNGFDSDAETLLARFMGFKLDDKILLNSAIKLMESKTAELAGFYH